MIWPHTVERHANKSIEADHGRHYYERKRAEGKTPKEVLRCVERRLSDRVYRQLVRDRQGRIEECGSPTTRPPTPPTSTSPASRSAAAAPGVEALGPAQNGGYTRAAAPSNRRGCKAWVTTWGGYFGLDVTGQLTAIMEVMREFGRTGMAFD